MLWKMKIRDFILFYLISFCCDETFPTLKSFVNLVDSIKWFPIFCICVYFTKKTEKMIVNSKHENHINIVNKGKGKLIPAQKTFCTVFICVVKSSTFTIFVKIIFELKRAKNHFLRSYA